MPFSELRPPPPNPPSVRIGKHIASLVPDGATLQMGIGSVPDAALAQLGGHRNLGIHTERKNRSSVPFLVLCFCLLVLIVCLDGMVARLVCLLAGLFALLVCVFACLVCLPVCLLGLVCLLI